MKALEYLKALKVDNAKFPCTVGEAIAELKALKYNYEAQEIIIRDKTALIEAIELNNKNGELSGIKKAFDIIKTVQANTNDILKYNILDDIADLVLEEAPYLKTQWESIIKLQQRIEELEALQSPKTCETCKHNDGDCAVLDILQDAFGFESDNCICPNYKPKDHK